MSSFQQAGADNPQTDSARPTPLRLPPLRRKERSRKMRSYYGIEDWLSRAQHLSDGDRILVEKAYGEQFSCARLAEIFDVSSSVIRRRLRRINRVLSDPCFLLIARFGECLPVGLRPIARSYYIDGLSLRKCAAHYHFTLYEVRQMLNVVRSVLILREAPLDLPMRAAERNRAVHDALLKSDR